MADSNIHEPPYTRNISNETVCNYYYYLSVIILVLGTLSVFVHVYVLFTGPGKLRGPIIASLVMTVISLGIAYFIYLFAYLICSRSLLDKKQ